MEVFVWVTAGEAKVFKAETLVDLRHIVEHLNEHWSLWDRVLMPMETLLDAHSSGGMGSAKAAIVMAVAPIIRDYSDDRCESGTGFGKVISVNV